MFYLMVNSYVPSTTMKKSQYIIYGVLTEDITVEEARAIYEAGR